LEIQANINAEFKDQIEEVQQLQRDVAFYTEQLQRESATMSDAQITELQEKIIGLREEYAAKGQPLQQNLQRRAGEERNKLLALIKQAIDKIAADENYDLILNAGSASFAKQELDLSADVLEQVRKLN
jgi:outer membrane protein